MNTMDLRINDETKSWFTKSFDLVKKFVAEGGYRLYPDKITVPVKASVCDTVTVTHRWNNIGWGYCPNNIPQWNYRYKVALALMDSYKEIVKIFVDPQAEPSQWYKGCPVEYATSIDLAGIAPGKYMWAIGIVDTAKDNTIGLDIAVPRTYVNEDGWTRLRKIRIY